MTTVVVRVKFEIAVKCVTSDITIWLKIFKITNDDDSCTQLSLFVQLSTIVFIRAIAWQQLVVHFVTMVVVMITTVVDIATMVVAYTWCHSSTGIGQLPLVPVVSEMQEELHAYSGCCLALDSSLFGLAIPGVGPFIFRSNSSLFLASVSELSMDHYLLQSQSHFFH